MRRGAALLLAGLLVLPACSGTDSPSDRGPRPVSAGAELAYGLAPMADPAGITYQPDVVIVGGGADVVRSVSGDSLTWTLNDSAAHIEDLEPGKVMFLTSRAVGRVLVLDRHDGVVDVTLGPVDLTDVIYDGDLHVEAPIDVDAMTFQTFPDAVTADITDTSGDAAATVNPAVWTGGRLAAEPDLPLPPPSRGKSVKVTVGGLSVQVARKASAGNSELSLSVAGKLKGVVLALEVVTKLTSPTVNSFLSIDEGRMSKQELTVDGLKEIAVSLDSGTETGLSGNSKIRFEVPAEMAFPIPGPVPMTESIRFKFIIATAFSARNGTVRATGRLKVDGPLGFSGDTVVVPKVTEAQSPLDTLSGVSVGVNGIVIAAQFKLMVGLGVPAAYAGPFAAITFAYGLTIGSAIGQETCYQASLDVIIAGGLGYTLDSKMTDFLKQLVPRLPWPVKVDSEFLSKTKTVVHTRAWAPLIRLCKT